MHPEWKYPGIRMELDWKWNSTVEVQLKEVALTSHHAYELGLMGQT